MLSAGNLANIAQQASYLAVFASAQMLVLLVRGFDLSLGACMSAASVLSALVLTGAFTRALSDPPLKQAEASGSCCDSRPTPSAVLNERPGPRRSARAGPA